MKRKSIVLCAAISSIMIAITACSNSDEAAVTVPEETSLLVEAFQGDVKYAYFVNEEGETVTIVIPDGEDKFKETLETVSEETTETTVSTETENEVSERQENNSSATTNVYTRQDKELLYKIYPLKAVTIPDDIDITSMSVPADYRYAYNDDGGCIGKKPFGREEFDLTNTTVKDITERTELKCDNDIYYSCKIEDSNFYFFGPSFNSVNIEVLGNNRYPLEKFDETETADGKVMDGYKIKAVTTKPEWGSDVDITFGGVINSGMERDEIEDVLGRGYEVQGKEKGETISYYQNSKGAMAIKYGYSNHYEREYMDSITVIVKSENDKCEDVPQPQRAKQSVPEETTITSAPDVTEETTSVSYGIFHSYEHFDIVSSPEGTYLYVRSNIMSAEEKNIFDLLLLKHPEYFVVYEEDVPKQTD